MHRNSSTTISFRSRLLTAITEEQHSLRNIHTPYANAIMPKNEHCPFLDSIPQSMKVKQLNFQLKEGRIHLKPFFCTKANYLNQYVIPALGEFRL